MKLKLPPAVIFVFFGGFMYVLDLLLPVGEFDFFGRFWLIRILLVLAITVGCLSLFQFIRAKTTIDPLTPSKSSRLVTQGVYRISRNPMYFALLLLLLAFGLWLGNVFNTLLAAGFVSYMNAFQIIPEEEVLVKLYGKEYQQYCIKVRRWF
ncbi:isoprenylcysteine carboxylmethyltransferase family protein [Flavobacteriaceae bacterium KMM 6897]|nr:isoprenylcysteine carboxylmethyltransferase family protein [Flavobacteriaceae bacterium KMM 6897]MEB8347514.1 isoprenylcysteine carboxylmethyltransferase family protein [Flavobacteriaceae bacterium KMM 6898]